MATILISGGSGLIGRSLSKRCIANGHHVRFLGRSAGSFENIHIYAWHSPEAIHAIKNADYIVHLAGANVGESRWTASRKKQIIDSRVDTASFILSHIDPDKTKAYISASGLGFYDQKNTTKVFKETDAPVADFLSETCQKWEASADDFETLGIRSVKIRIGVVLAKEGGALSKMLLPTKLGLGSALGNGQQFMPWIHIDDVSAVFEKAIFDDKMSGIYNAAAPEQATNQVFMKKIAETLNKPFFMPNVPAFLIKLLFGEMATVVLDGSRVSVDKLLASGFMFKFPDLKGALKDVLN